MDIDTSQRIYPLSKDLSFAKKEYRIYILCQAASHALLIVILEHTFGGIRKVITEHWL